MGFLILEIIFLLIIAYLIGCLLGFWLRRSFGSGSSSAQRATGRPSSSPPQSTAAAAKMTPAAGTAPRVPDTTSSAPAAAPVAATSAPAKAPAIKAPAKARSAAKPAAKPAAKSAAKSATGGASAKTKAPRAKPAAGKSSPAQRAAKAPGAKARAASPAGAADDLKRIGGVGKVIEGKLNAMGIHRYDQIAAWGPKDVAEVDEKLAFKGRVERENWIEQAKTLAAGGETEFSKRSGK